ncbi:MAG: hypothetical protein IKQ27_15085 [Lachnospiraceae bacterium]|nr:hypothetical protein [Lachnospiraceae bacterium]MBR6158278.1 hypothetical protein [Lachnospiraceae bacterium]
MEKKPEIRSINQCKYWENTFADFCVQVVKPECAEITEIVNYGFMTPYLLVFEEKKMSGEEAVDYAERTGLAEIAKPYGGTVVFVYPAGTDGWNGAKEDLFASVIAESKIGQYYEDGMTRARDRFTGAWGEYYIRGALNRTIVFGSGASADYLACNCLKTIEGDGLYGKGDITPVTLVLEKLSVIPKPERRDMAVVSVGNSDVINRALEENVDHVLITDTADYAKDFSFMKKYRRMVGKLEEEIEPASLGLSMETGYAEVATSKDNRGDDQDTTSHKIGYVAYYNKEQMQQSEGMPLLMCFHGGGDSAMCMVCLTDWHKVVAKYNFLLVSVENHMNSTATEAMELIEHIKKTYKVNTEKIYATGFSMGGCKSWDLFQEYPSAFAAVAPMDATFEVGLNAFGQPVGSYNQDTILPVFYVGGEDSLLPELPFQEPKCLDRMAYVLRVNRAKTQNHERFDAQENWKNKIYAIDGDVICKAEDEKTGSTLTMHLFESENGCCYSIFASASKQSHEMRWLNCENAWKYMSQFSRKANGEIEGGNMEEVITRMKG